MELNKIYQEDCLIGMARIPDKSIDAIICDLPYGVLNKQNNHTKWDIELPLDKLWEEYNRIIKDNGVIILFGQGMFTAKLMMSNPKMWRYNLIWGKGNRSTGFLNANRMPLRNHEDILVFYKKQPVFHPQMSIGNKNHTRGANKPKTNNCYGKFKYINKEESNLKYPKSIICIEKEHIDFLHPTQKPVALIEYLIRSYTNNSDVVLDNCMGSGTTAVACINTERNFLGFEKDKKFYDLACERLKSSSN